MATVKNQEDQAAPGDEQAVAHTRALLHRPHAEPGAAERDHGRHQEEHREPDRGREPQPAVAEDHPRDGGGDQAAQHQREHRSDRPDRVLAQVAAGVVVRAVVPVEEVQAQGDRGQIRSPPRGCRMPVALVLDRHVARHGAEVIERRDGAQPGGRRSTASAARRNISSAAVGVLVPAALVPRVAGQVVARRTAVGRT